MDSNDTDRIDMIRSDTNLIGAAAATMVGPLLKANSSTLRWVC
jgi:hypothetical protein